jgi:hypothetical protein
VSVWSFIQFCSEEFGAKQDSRDVNTSVCTNAAILSRIIGLVHSFANGNVRGPAGRWKQRCETFVFGSGDAHRVKCSRHYGGCDLADAQEKVQDKFIMFLMGGRPVIYILRSHGPSGVLKSKIRASILRNRSRALVLPAGQMAAIR